jgi:SET domain-containing protein
MMLVRTHLRASPIHGLGVFAAERIPAGTPTWRFEEGLDQEIDTERVDSLPAHIREWFEIYGYKDARTGRIVLCFDHGRFVNHADAPNTRQDFDLHPLGVDVAVRDIEAGEELTCDYGSLEGVPFRP